MANATLNDSEKAILKSLEPAIRKHKGGSKKVSEAVRKAIDEEIVGIETTLRKIVRDAGKNERDVNERFKKR